MFIEDQDEDVEEEEEFHEVEEEKHRTSQESVGSGAGTSASGGDKVIPQPSQPDVKEQQQPTQTNDETEPSPKSDSSMTTTDINNSENSTTAAPETTTTNNNKNSNDASTTPTNDSKSVDTDKSDATGTKNVDWANLMLSNAATEIDSQREDSADLKDDDRFENVEEKETEDSFTKDLDSIVQDTKQKLKLDDEERSTKDSCSPDRLELNNEAVSSTAAPQDQADTSDGQHQDIQIPLDSPTEQLVEKDADQGAKETQDNQEDPKPDSIVADESSQEPALDSENKVDDAEKKELDLDEDVKNPQYIPKKGVFYEHDDRSQDVDDKKQSSTSANKEEETVEVKESAGSKKVITQEKPNDNRKGNRKPRTDSDRWNHDLFRDEKQKPKSKSELINVYGYDIRQERAPRNNNPENRTPRGINNTNNDRTQGGQDNQRMRQTRENRAPRQNQSTNRSRERKPRRQSTRNNRNDSQGGQPKRDGPSNNNRSLKSDFKDVKPQEPAEEKPQASQSLATPTFSNQRREHDVSRDKNTRNDSRGRRKTSRDRPNTNTIDDKLPPINTVMSPITLWSNEDMAKAEALSKESPSRHQAGINNNIRGRQTDYWQQNQPNKSIYQDRSVRNVEDNRQQHYNSRNRYHDRDESHKPTQFINRNHYNDRSNQHNQQDWHRTSNFNSYSKPNDYIVKTQTFENSRLAQSSMNRSNPRDLREVINERRMQGQNYQPKTQGSEQVHQRGQIQNQHFVQPHHQQHLMHQQHMMQHHQQAPQHLPQQPQQQQQQPTQSSQPQQTQSQQQPAPNQSQQPQPQSTPQTSQQIQNQRQQPTSQAQQHQNQTRQNLLMNSLDENVQDSNRLNAGANNDLINSRPIIKTDAYTGVNVAPHQQQPQTMQQHSQNHRSIGGPMSQGPNPASSHLVPSHLGAGGTQAQYYTPSSNARDSAAAAAALATAYHGYIPSGHSVMDTTARYHMTSQQLSDHGYMGSPGQAGDVAAASVLHQQGIYTDAASAGGTVASSAYLAQAGSTISPTTNIPVTGAGQPLPPVSYLQHSQYPPPPYSNPYSHNQAPPQSSHAYPYWTYI